MNDLVLSSSTLLKFSFRFILMSSVIIISRITQTNSLLIYCFFDSSATSDYRQSLQFQNLNEEKRNIKVEVMLAMKLYTNFCLVIIYVLLVKVNENFMLSWKKMNR